MKMYFPVSLNVSCLFLATTLTACGGGGSSGYSAPTPPPAAAPAATASFAQPSAATTINLGQSVSLQWSSTGSTGCPATAASASGGTFTGSQSMTGTAAEVPTAPGTYTY